MHYMKVRDGLVCPKMHLLTTLQGGKGASGLAWHAQKIESVPSFFDWVYRIGPCHS